MKTRSKKKPAPRRRKGTKRKITQSGWGVDIKNGWLKPALNFIGLAISTWDLVLIWPTVSNVEIPASIDWTRLPNNTTLITVMLLLLLKKIKIHFKEKTNFYFFFLR